MVRLDRLPDGKCPRCPSTKILGPRVVRDDEKWCHCYECGHTWQTNKSTKQKGGHPSLSWNPNLKEKGGTDD